MPLSKIVAKSITDDTITTDQIADTSVHGRRNLIINGAMQVWQRGTSFTSNDFGPDRFAVYPTTNGTTFQRSTDAPDGFAYSLTTSGTPTGSYLILTPVELPATGDAGLLYNGQKITISYYAKSSSAGDELYNKLTFRDTSTSATNEVSVDNDSSDKHTLTTSWARYSKTYTIGVNPAGTNKSFVVNPRSVSAPSGNISITGIQLEVGEQATPFEHRSYGEELALCHRYYEKATSGNTAGMTCDATASVNYHVPFKHATEMRATPAYTWTEWTSSGFPATAPTFQQAGKNGVNVYKTCSITGSGRYWLGYVTADAEL